MLEKLEILKNNIIKYFSVSICCRVCKSVAERGNLVAVLVRVLGLVLILRVK